MQPGGGYRGCRQRDQRHGHDVHDPGRRRQPVPLSKRNGHQRCRHGVGKFQPRLAGSGERSHERSIDLRIHHHRTDADGEPRHVVTPSDVLHVPVDAVHRHMQQRRNRQRHEHIPLTSADQGDTIEVSVTATNTAGTSAAVTSSAVGPVVPPAPSYSAAPGISGTTESGDTLTEKPGTWPGYTGQLAIQWTAARQRVPPSPGRLERPTRLPMPMWVPRCRSRRRQRTPAARRPTPTHRPGTGADPITKSRFIRRARRQCRRTRRLLWPGRR